MSAKEISMEVVATKILLIRGKKVMLDRDLAQLYGVSTKVLLQSVKRNLSRFPGDFMFQLTKEEAESSRSQFVTLNDSIDRQRLTTSKRGKNIKYLPYVFTDKLDELERKYQLHETDIQVIFQAIKKLLEPPPEEPPKPRFGMN